MASTMSKALDEKDSPSFLARISRTRLAPAERVILLGGSISAIILLLLKAAGV